MEKQNFINAVKEGAIEGNRECNVLASLTIAQAILESAWGDSKLTKDANNLFGIKAYNWSGRAYRSNTGEYENGSWTTEENCPFRVYDSWTESIEDHTRLLCTARYATVRAANNYVEACREVKACGYATDPNYTNLLIELIEENNLQEFDGEVANNISSSCSNIILKFQRLCNNEGIEDYDGCKLDEDGIIGARTKSCIEKLPLLKLGSKGEFVSFLQEALNKNEYGLNIDGDFGGLTRSAVIRFQEAESLDADGIVGINTWGGLVTD